MNFTIKIKLLILLMLLLSGCNQKTDNSENLDQKEKKTVTKISEPKKQSLLPKIKSQTNPKQYKINMFFISQEGCGACAQVREYMEDEDIKEILEKDFIVKEIDITQKEKLPYSWMEPIATPTLYFLNPKGEEIVDTVVKRLGELEFTEILEEVIEIRDME